MQKNDRKYSSDISNEEIVRISNRYNPLSNDNEDSNEMNDIDNEDIIDSNKRKEKKKTKGSKKHVNIRNKIPR